MSGPTPKFFAISAVVADYELHEIMTLLEERRAMQIGARPVPVEASAALLEASGVMMPAPGQRLPRELAAPDNKPPGAGKLPPGGKGKERPRVEGVYEAMQAATRAFFGMHDEFTIGDFRRAIAKVARGTHFNASSRLKYYVEAKRIISDGRGRYRVAKQERSSNERVEPV